MVSRDIARHMIDHLPMGNKLQMAASGLVSQIQSPDATNSTMLPTCVTDTMTTVARKQMRIGSRASPSKRLPIHAFRPVGG